jgi:adenosylmethionine-8-amino-7-oxononanoate aminotransferase
VELTTRPTAPLPPANLPLAVSAAGCHVHTADGRTMFDGSSGAVTVNLGHGNEHVISEATRQMRTLTFSYRTQFRAEPVERLGRRLSGLFDGAYPVSVFTNSGSEAMEQALRLAHRWHEARGQVGRRIVLSESPSFHGMTLGALAGSGHAPRHQTAMPWVEHASTIFVQVAAPAEPGARAGAEDWTRAIAAAGEDLAAVILEPVSGASGGAAPADPATMRAIRASATEVGALVISDEVMTGLGRLGTWSPSVAAGMAPDMLVVAKGLGAGYAAIGAVLLARSCPLIDGAAPADLGTHGHTMGGNPVACAVANAVLDELQDREILDAVNRRAATLRAAVEESVTVAGFASSTVRGAGFLLAVSTAHLPNPRATSAALVHTAMAHDLIIHAAGIDDPTASILVAPPLTASDADLDELTAKLTRTFATLPY